MGEVIDESALSVSQSFPGRKKLSRFFSYAYRQSEYFIDCEKEIISSDYIRYVNSICFFLPSRHEQIEPLDHFTRRTKAFDFLLQRAHSVHFL